VETLLPADPRWRASRKLVVSADGKGYADCYFRLLSGLFVVEGPELKTALAWHPAFVIGSVKTG